MIQDTVIINTIKGEAMKKFIILTLIITSIYLLSACRNEETESLKTLGLYNLTSEEILSQLASNELVPNGYAVSVYDHKLVVITEDNQFELPMPEDYFYLSVAPYINQTHPCLIHSATGCQGEMVDETISIEFKDYNGNILYSDTLKTQTNGFVDLWLPRDKEGILTVTYNNLSASRIITTYRDDPTCETTLRLT
jgi:hypothetical protein